MTFSKTEIHSIAVFRALQLGDILCTVPAFRVIRKAFPNSHISLIGLPWAKDFTQRFSSYFDSFISFPGFPGLPEQPYNSQKIVAFLQYVQQKKFDLLFQMQGDGTIVNLLIALMDARYTAGFYTENSFKPNDTAFFLYPEHKNEIVRWISLVEQLGIPSQGTYLEFPISANEIHEARLFMYYHSLIPQKYICVHPGSRNAKRRWSPLHFAKVADAMAQKGFIVVITGTAEEKDLTQDVIRHMQYPCIDLTGKTKLGILAALLKSAKLLISNDTGVSHVASALHIPSIVIFQDSEPLRWAPLDKKLHKVIAKERANDIDTIINTAITLV